MGETILDDFSSRHRASRTAARFHLAQSLDRDHLSVLGLFDAKHRGREIEKAPEKKVLDARDNS